MYYLVPRLLLGRRVPALRPAVRAALARRLGWASRSRTWEAASSRRSALDEESKAAERRRREARAAAAERERIAAERARHMPPPLPSWAAYEQQQQAAANGGGTRRSRGRSRRRPGRPAPPPTSWASYRRRRRRRRRCRRRRSRPSERVNISSKSRYAPALLLKFLPRQRSAELQAHEHQERAPLHARALDLLALFVGLRVVAEGQYKRRDGRQRRALHRVDVGAAARRVALAAVAELAAATKSVAARAGCSTALLAEQLRVVARARACKRAAASMASATTRRRTSTGQIGLEIGLTRSACKGKPPGAQFSSGLCAAMLAGLKKFGEGIGLRKKKPKKAVKLAGKAFESRKRRGHLDCECLPGRQGAEAAELQEEGAQRRRPADRGDDERVAAGRGEAADRQSGAGRSGVRPTRSPRA